jgi:hypothetical protein
MSYCITFIYTFCYNKKERFFTYLPTRYPQGPVSKGETKYVYIRPNQVKYRVNRVLDLKGFKLSRLPRVGATDCKSIIGCSQATDDRL